MKFSGEILIYRDIGIAPGLDLCVTITDQSGTSSATDLFLRFTQYTNVMVNLGIGDDDDQTACLENVQFVRLDCTVSECRAKARIDEQ